jgi:hypothetical protein
VLHPASIAMISTNSSQGGGAELTVGAGRDVVERGRRGRVQPRVEEAERLLAGGEELVVEERWTQGQRRRREAKGVRIPIVDAKMGLAQLVPSTPPTWPPSTIWRLTPCTWR